MFRLLLVVMAPVNLTLVVIFTDQSDPSSSSSSQIPAESSAHDASVPGELWTQRDQPVLECVK